jgi:hypothetical protein
MTARYRTDGLCQSAADDGHTVFVQSRALPPDLVATLRRAREVEAAAVDRREAWLRAVRATSILLAAADEAGWRAFEVAGVLGMSVTSVRVRVRKGRRWRGDTHGLDVTPAPPPPGHCVPPLPVAVREWLTAKQAAALAGIARPSLYQWHRAGLLPRTRTDRRPWLYARSDLERIVEAPCYRNVGVSWSAVREAIAAEQPG